MFIDFYILIYSVSKLFINHWQPLLTLTGVVVSILAFFVSIYSIFKARSESIFANRAYINVVVWNTSDNNRQFQFSFTNSGKTPATNFKVIANWIFDDIVSQDKVLAENIELLHGLDSKINPIVALNFTENENQEIMSSTNVHIQLRFEHEDYVNKTHITTTEFLLHKTIPTYKLTLIKHTTIQ